ncbi:glycoside hydrolase family 3 C-terminal domain-containing protein [Gallaecimonas mangrovi]|uniref:glycoside hydrolase family 3 C-terminal domain-containing protein n=1 Tax=Gallaecimonas mangrovi TaxID=2291597 RepID=UPI0018678986|nr:glycoside hydrolase family 3 C-terminal domain-containing protein [Gallaecimonas mangrovi]
MTEAEKIAYIHAGSGYLLPPFDRFDLPGTNSVDSSMGIRVKATKALYGASYPSQTALAATWNYALAQEEGLALGYETRMSGAEHQLSPVVNLYRTPLGGRNAESICGEDPFLCAVMAPALTNGIQAQGVTSTAKHWLANEQEANRYNLDVEMAARPMRELYMPPFESLVKNANIAAVMCGFNYINGVQACSNHFLITDVLKGEWGFHGMVSSDFNSIVNTYDAAQAGTDMDQPSGYYFTVNKLTPYLEDGTLSQDVIDNKVRRNLRTLVRFGFDKNVYDAQTLTEPEHGEQASIDVARQGIVLLKNKGASGGDGGLLPLSKSAKIAVIGRMADLPPGSPFGTPYSVPTSGYVTELAGLQSLNNSTSNITYISSMSPVPKTAVWYQPDCTASSDSCETGIKAEYYDNTDLSGDPELTRTEAGINFDWTEMTDVTADGTRDITDVTPTIGSFGARFTGKFKPTISGRQVFKVRADGPFKLWIDGELVAQSDGTPKATDLVVTIEKSIKTKKLTAGKLYSFKLEYSRLRAFSAKYGSICGVQLSWASLEPPTDLSDYDAVVAVVGRDFETDGETLDHNFTLPEAQGYMLKEVTKANSNTVVVMHGGGAMLMLPWANNAGAILHAWYSGQFGGQALAEILYGDVNPSGKLPITLDKWLKYNPSYASYSDPDDYLGDDAKTTMTYSEGLNMGYRGYESSTHKPLYPFGFGLSYTSFSFSNLKLSSSDVTQDGTINATVTVTNSGGRAGYETAELYVQPVNPSVDRPDHELKGFAKVYLEAGESKTVTIPLNARSFSYYVQSDNTWKVPAGSEFNVLVGDSSDNLPLSQAVTAPDAISVGTYYSNPLPYPLQQAVQVSADEAY